jgi:hypothetical protein
VVPDISGFCARQRPSAPLTACGYLFRLPYAEHEMLEMMGANIFPSGNILLNYIVFSAIYFHLP